MRANGKEEYFDVGHLKKGLWVKKNWSKPMSSWVVNMGCSLSRSKKERIIKLDCPALAKAFVSDNDEIMGGVV